MRSFILQVARTSNYPGHFRALREIIGDDKAAILAEHFGGTSLYIPAKASSEHQLSALIGIDTVQQVCAQFSGVTVGVPRLVELQRSNRNAQIRADHAAGMSQRKLARKYKLTDRHIRSILNS